VRVLVRFAKGDPVAQGDRVTARIVPCNKNPDGTLSNCDQKKRSLPAGQQILKLAPLGPSNRVRSTSLISIPSPQTSA
jgi:antitoxin (DNA-binding transcriptional repressor) of toxin-antitoxin stability system